MWNLTVAWWELVLRGVIIYVFLLVLLRVTGKRQVGQMSAFDLVLLLILSNAVQNAMNGGDNSVVAGLILAVTLVGLNYATGIISYKSRRFETFIEGRPEVLIHNGTLYQQVLERQNITQNDLHAALRAANCPHVEDVQLAILENNGHITIQPMPKPQPPADSNAGKTTPS